MVAPTLAHKSLIESSSNGQPRKASAPASSSATVVSWLRRCRVGRIPGRFWTDCQFVAGSSKDTVRLFPLWNCIRGYIIVVLIEYQATMCAAMDPAKREANSIAAAGRTVNRDTLQ